ncbi:C1 family peptidase [Bacillus paralicheniformis]|uniref:C1 family peptidase n=1 Tax=Bacillus paralicheniformis TaxID=1648923 RepID=UPI00363AF414
MMHHGGTNGGDGLYIIDALKMIQKYGGCEEKYWKYEECNPGNPQPRAEENAEQHKINVYAKLDTLDSIKKSLLVNGPCVAGVFVYSNWGQNWSTGEIPMPGESEFLGGHAICIVGYDDDKKYLKFKNSWGPEWGDNGYGYLPYDYMSLDGSEAWGITDLIIDPEPLIQSKEKVLEDLGVEFKDKSQEFKDFETTIKFH